MLMQCFSIHESDFFPKVPFQGISWAAFPSSAVLQCFICHTLCYVAAAYSQHLSHTVLCSSSLQLALQCVCHTLCYQQQPTASVQCVCHMLCYVAAAQQQQPSSVSERGHRSLCYVCSSSLELASQCVLPRSCTVLCGSSLVACLNEVIGHCVHCATYVAAAQNWHFKHLESQCMINCCGYKLQPEVSNTNICYSQKSNEHLHSGYNLVSKFVSSNEVVDFYPEICQQIKRLRVHPVLCMQRSQKFDNVFTQVCMCMCVCV